MASNPGPMTVHVGPTGPFRLVEGVDVEPVAEWGEIEGRQRPTGQQARSKQGLPLWDLAALVMVDQWGRQVPTPVVLRLAAPSQPSPAAFLFGATAAEAQK